MNIQTKEIEKSLRRSLISDLSDARSCLMGCAIFAIVLYHMWARIVEPEGLFWRRISPYIWLGYGGCDVFLFLSGFGLAFSLAKDRGFARYIGRRAMKIFPSYYPFIVVYILATIVTKGMTLQQIVGNLTFTGFWVEMSNQFNWYVQAVMALYLLAPVIAWIFREMGDGWKTGMLLAFLCVLALTAYWNQYQMVLIARVPVFLMGYYLGVCDKEKTVWTKWIIAAAVIAFFVGFKIEKILHPFHEWGNGFFWYPFILIAPSFCLIVAWLRPYCLRWKLLSYLDKGLCVLGVSSFEIYLIHDLFVECFPHGAQNNIQWVALAISSSLAGIGYHYLVENVVKLCRKRKAQVG